MKIKTHSGYLEAKNAYNMLLRCSPQLKDLLNDHILELEDKIAEHELEVYLKNDIP